MELTLDMKLDQTRQLGPGVQRYTSRAKDKTWICDCVHESVAQPDCEKCSGSGLGATLRQFDIDPEEPCPYPPGSLGKLGWLCRRYDKGVDLWCKQDKRMSSDTVGEDYDKGSEKRPYVISYQGSNSWNAYTRHLVGD